MTLYLTHNVFTVIIHSTIEPLKINNSWEIKTLFFSIFRLLALIQMGIDNDTYK